MTDLCLDWTRRAWALVDKLPPGIAGDLNDRWRSHREKKKLIVTFFGPYDSGKSSLLKRLLVDDGKPVPEWLTVSGRRETFEIHGANVLGVMVEDTPGIAGGNERHEEMARDALLLSDALVLVLPPQLMTSDKEEILAVLTGRMFSCSASAAFPGDGVSIVLSRIDEAGAMPREDPDGFKALVLRKREELRAIFGSSGVGDHLSVFPLAADPFGLVGNAAPKSKDVYDAERSWDGVEAFARFLEGLADKKSELRDRSEVRFLGAEISTVDSALKEMIEENRSAAEAGALELEHLHLVGQRLAALVDSARSDLNRRIEEGTSTLVRWGTGDPEKFKKTAQDRFETILDQWEREQNNALEALSTEADTEMRARRDSLGWKKLVEVLLVPDGGGKASPGGASWAKAVDRVKRVSDVIRKGIREAHPAVIGMPMKTAERELQRLNAAASFKEYAEKTRKGSVAFKTADQARKAERAMKLNTFLEVGVPVFTELCSLAGEAIHEGQAARQRAARRRELRQAIEDESQTLAEQAFSIWCEDGLPAILKAAIGDAENNAETALDALRQEGAVFASHSKNVSQILNELNELG